MYRYRGKGKQQAILLLLLFLFAAAQGMWGQDEVIFLDGVAKLTNGKTYILKGATGGRIEINGNVTLIVEGENKLWYRDGVPAIRVDMDDVLTIQGRAEGAILKVFGSYQTPGIGTIKRSGPSSSYQVGIINIEGPIYVEAQGASETPGIGGGDNSLAGPTGGGPLNLKNGAIVNTDAGCKSTTQLSTLSISGYATLYTKRIRGAMTKRPVKYNKLQGTQPSGYVSFSMDGIEGNTYVTTTGYDEGKEKPGLYSDIPLYFPSDPTPKDYALIDGIPTPMDETAPHMGAAYKDDKSVYYPSIGTTFNSSLTLNVTNYPHSGTLTADGLITLSGNNRKLCTAADGLTLQATGSNLLTLSGINTPTNNKAGDKNKLIIDGHVFLSGNSSIASGAAVNQSGIAVF